jgi:hypothetical protein
MWLINTDTLKLESFQECPADTYAILSHTWGTEAEELSFDEFRVGEGREKFGFQKIQKCCKQAQQDGLRYAWADTCCIDKRSSSELSEAINSMFSWYARAKICYVYLADVCHTDPLNVRDNLQSFSRSRWFTRGWTLQELIAPRIVSFYAQDWTWIGDKSSLAEILEDITGISGAVLVSQQSFLDCSVAQRMSWASQRQTTRVEDLAYCLIGLFNTNIPLLYGEGSKAFLRLQQAIIRQTDDETIFAWTGVGEGGSGLLAPSPANFVDSASIGQDMRRRDRPPYEETNRGLSIECQLLPCEMNTYVVPLNCNRRRDGSSSRRIVIFLCRTSEDQQYRRVSFRGKCIDESTDWDISKGAVRKVFVPEDGRTLELAPHGGLPLIHIESNLESWHFSKTEPEAQDPARVMSTRRAAGDLESGVADTRDFNSSLCECVPDRATHIAFQSCSGDLEKGVVISFRRPTSREGVFHYYLEIGFDVDFTPVCILWTSPFRLLTCARQKRLLPARNSLWSGRRSIPAGIFNFSKGSSRRNTGALRPLETSIFDFWILSTFMPHHESPDLRYVIGDRVNGLKLSIDDFLPAIYGCTKVNLGFRPSDGLSWELTFKEEQLHSGSRFAGAACFQRWLVSVVKILRFYKSVWLGLDFWALVLWFWTYGMGAAWFLYLFHITTSQAIGVSMMLFFWPLLSSLLPTVTDSRDRKFLPYNHQCRLANHYQPPSS